MNLVKSTRLERGLTMTALAIAAGIPMASLSRIERGARCSQSTAIKLAEALGVPVREVFPDFGMLRPF